MKIVIIILCVLTAAAILFIIVDFTSTQNSSQKLIPSVAPTQSPTPTLKTQYCGLGKTCPSGYVCKSVSVCPSNKPGQARCFSEVLQCVKK